MKRKEQTKKLNTQLNTTLGMNPVPVIQDSGIPTVSKLYEWSAAERFWTPKDKPWFVTYSLFFVVIIAMAAILGQYIFILAVIAFVFLWFTQAAIPPERVTHSVNTLGVKTFGHLYKWRDIKHYWFSTKHGINYLNLDIVDDKNPSNDRTRRLSLLLENNEDMELFFVLMNYADYGDKDEIGYNIIAKAIHGQYIPITFYLPEDNLTQEEYIEEKDLFGEESEESKPKASKAKEKKK